MDQQNLEAELHFSQPIRQVILMLIAIGLTCAGVILALPVVMGILTANIWLNGFILLVFLIGVLSCIFQVAQLIYSVRWIENFARDNRNQSTKAPQLLAPLATLLRTRGRMQIAASSTRSILDSVATRIEEAREFTRYIVNLLIFLGLLGTFYGLATTVPALVDTIRSLAPQDGESGFEVFNRLMNGLEGQLGGMGVAFSSSLFGLAGSLVVGLLELFAGHGQNRFYRELEEWLSTITRLGFSSASEGETSGEHGLFTAVLDQMSEQMEAIRVMFAQSDQTRAVVDEKIGTLVDTLTQMSARLEQSTPSNATLERVAVGQERLLEVLTDMHENDAVDAESRMRLRSIDVQMLHLMEDMSAGRQETVSAIRNDIHALTNALVRAVTEIEASGRTKG